MKIKNHVLFETNKVNLSVNLNGNSFTILVLFNKKNQSVTFSNYPDLETDENLQIVTDYLINQQII